MLSQQILPRVLRMAASIYFLAGCNQGAPLRDWTQSRWKAQWIASPDAPARDAGVFHFRKTINLPNPPASFVVHVSADNRFILYVNGKQFGAGPASSDLFHWRYETFDLAPLLHAGDNVIGATVWNFGIQTQVAQMSDRTAFILQGDGELEQIANTDTGWQVELENGHHLVPVSFGPALHTYYAGPPGEVIDGPNFDWNWNTAPQTDSSGKWKVAKVIGAGAPRAIQDAPTAWMLLPDSLPPMETKPVSLGQVVGSSGVSVANSQEPFTVPANSKASVTFDVGTLTTAYPELTMSGSPGSRVRVTYAEALVDERRQKGNRNEVKGRHIEGVYDEFIADGSSHRSFSPLIWRTWRYLQLDITTGDGPLTVDAMKATFSAYPFREKAAFSSDDPALSKIWEVGWRTARLCAHDTYMDTPYYERLQYVGDTRLQALISYAVAGDDRLARQAIDAIDNSRTPEGITESRFPSSLPQFIPPFSLLWVGMIHDFWMHRPDPDFVRAHLPGTRTVLDWFVSHQRPDGLLGKLPWWDFVDWTKDFSDGVPPQDRDGGSSVITLQLIEALRNAAELERALGDSVRANRYTEYADKAAHAIYQLCWNNNYGLIADTPGQTHYSQHANALAVWLDVIPPKEQSAVMNEVLAADNPPMSKASYYFIYYIVRALEHAGLADQYLSILQPWRQMLDLGLSTWAENPEPTRSDSHAWSSHPNYDLLRLVAGIRSTAPGFSKMVIEPHLGPLHTVKASMPHPKGRIDVSFATSPGGTNATIACPEGVEARLLWRGKSYPLHAGTQTLRLP
ncbi:MAG: family 78 glycoside hydrolase catalytic domain [Acidobacteriaceae bacterium]|nr:family 78 glycoside hydrolase catalytic domain [Acidobacteriaceae bacterium]